MTDRPPFVSIVCPLYNGERFLGDALRSLQAQTFPDFECLCIDDGGPDGSAAMAAAFAAEDPRFRLIRQKNAGVAAARNRGLAEARGETVTFMDQDDALPPEALQTLADAMKQTGCDVVMGAFQTFTTDDIPEAEQPAKTTLAVSETPLADFFEQPVDGDAWAKLYRRAALEGISFPDGVFGADDSVFSCRVFASIRRYARTDATVYLYRMHPDNVTSQMPMRYIMGYLRSRELLWDEVWSSPKTPGRLKALIARQVGEGILSWTVKKTCRQAYSAEEMSTLRTACAALRDKGMLRRLPPMQRLKFRLFLSGRTRLLRLLFPKLFRRRKP